MSKSDPYRHHPNLKGKIAPAETSFFRDFNIEKMERLGKEHNLPGGWWYSDAEREALRRATLKDRMNNDLWVFGYGSLMWDPALVFTEVRRARVRVYSRKFILKEDKGGRGSAKCPGVMAALDVGNGCDGLVLRLAKETLDNETRILWQREVVTHGYLSVFLNAETDHGAVEALAFVADHNSDVIEGSLEYSECVSRIATAAGILGSNFDYLEGVVTKLREFGIHDDEVEALFEDVQAFRATM